MQQASSNRLISLLLYVLGFLLFWEWLRPLVVIAKETDLNYFVSFAAFAFLLSYLRLPFWISFPAKFIGMGYALHILFFYNTSLFDPMWIHYFFNDFQENVAFIINGNWVGLTDLFRSFLFFVLLWIVSYLMHYWLIQARRLFLFFFVTVIYLTVLDTFTMYQADAAIVRTMIIGLVLIGLLRLIKIQEREKVTFEKGRWPISWLIGLCMLIVLTTLVGFTAPKLEPQWPDPVPFIIKAANGYRDSVGGGSGTQRIGYGANDTHLGGPFQMDDTVVFTATEPDAHYWKVETRNTYTGKGWTNSPNDSSKTLNDLTSLGDNPVLEAYESKTHVDKQTDTIHMSMNQFPQLVYGGDPLSIKGLGSDQLFLNTVSGKLEPESHGRTLTPKAYTVTYNNPTFSLPLLQKVTDSSEDPEAIKKADLQLPKELPSRVRALAVKITEGKTNRYDKAEAIVNYFNSQGYNYNTQDVAIPGPNQDYVDQFLFDTKQGYCDNFSTSMVVMLRSIGIPARWVKGFSQGTYKDTVNAQADEYIIKERDAHSWVEVYFPGSGWVPFEPTVGFSNVYKFSYSDSKSTPASTTPSKAETPKRPQVKPHQQKQPDQQSLTQKTSKVKSSFWFPTFHLKTVFWWGLGFICAAGVILALLVLTRRKWLPLLWKWRFKKRADEAALDVAFDKLIKLLALSGYKRKEGQTLREFARDVDLSLGTFDMVKLVRQIEKSRYFQLSDGQWLESKELWENMINRLRA